MNKSNLPIGIFDSGVGGISVLNTCISMLPNEHYIYYGDSLHAPYGVKSKDMILERCIFICDFLIDKGVKAIIVACNTATSVAIDCLRDRYTIPIIGMEPALKPAVFNKKKQTVVVMATPLTLKEEKFVHLLKQYEKEHHIIKMPCPLFVDIIEQNLQHRQALVVEQIHSYRDQILGVHIDSIVLGCTHFIFLKNEISNYFNNEVTLIDGHRGTVLHLIQILKENDLLSDQLLQVEIYNSDESQLDLSHSLVNIV